MLLEAAREGAEAADPEALVISLDAFDAVPGKPQSATRVYKCEPIGGAYSPIEIALVRDEHLAMVRRSKAAAKRRREERAA